MFEIAAYSPFVVAFLTILAILLFESLFLLIAGFTSDNLISTLLDTDSFAESAAINWIFVRGLPLSLFLVLALCGFSVTGFGLQWLSFYLSGSYESFAIAIPVAMLGAFTLVRMVGPKLARLMQDETNAIEPVSLTGLVAIIHSPVVTSDLPGDAKVTDRHGYRHTVMVQPVKEVEQFVAGDAVYLVILQGNTFLVSKDSFNSSQPKLG